MTLTIYFKNCTMKEYTVKNEPHVIYNEIWNIDCLSFEVLYCGSYFYNAIDLKNIERYEVK